MQKYGVNELRRMFLEFFESKDHLAMKSFSLVPHNDNSLLPVSYTHLGDQHIREIRGADRGGRHGGQDLPDD